MEMPEESAACGNTTRPKPEGVRLIDLVIDGEHHIAPANSAEPFRKIPPRPPGETTPMSFKPEDRPPGFSPEQIEVLEAKGFFPSGGIYVRMTKTAADTVYFEHIGLPE